MSNNNPLENMADQATMAMAVENLGDSIEYMMKMTKLLGMVEAEHFKTLIENGVPEELAAAIVSVQGAFPGIGGITGMQQDNE